MWPVLDLLFLDGLSVAEELVVLVVPAVDAGGEHGATPRADEPLPRLLDDPTAAKFVAILVEAGDQRNDRLPANGDGACAQRLAATPTGGCWATGKAQPAAI